MLWVVNPTSSETLLSPAMLSGLFTQYINGVEQPEPVVISTNDDLSFQLKLSVPSLLSRINALEEKIALLTNT